MGDIGTLAPRGVLRVAVAVGPAKSAVWTTRRPGRDAPEGVTVDLAEALARRLGVTHELVEIESSGAIVALAGADAWDLTFVPVDEERRRHVAFGPAYHRGESTYLVRAASPFVTAADVDRDGVRVLGVENTATLRSARRAARRAEVAGCATLADALAAFDAGRCDALALGQDSLRSLLAGRPGARMTEGAFHAAETAVAVPLARGCALPVVAAAMDALGRDGTVRRILERHGSSDAPPPP